MNAGQAPTEHTPYGFTLTGTLGLPPTPAIFIPLSSQLQLAGVTYVSGTKTGVRSNYHDSGGTMARIIIEGGFPLNGVYHPSGNKNAAMPIIVASLMTQGINRLSNIPMTLDIQMMLSEAAKCGCDVNTLDDVVIISCENLTQSKIGPPLPSSPQISLLLALPLLHHFGEASIEPINLSQDRLSTHLQVLEDFGIDVQILDNRLELKKAEPLKAHDVLLEEASVTATELSILLGVFAEGRSTLKNAACEPHIHELIIFLNSCGAEIEGGGSNVITITGKKKLQGINYSIMSDHIEIGSMVGLAVATGGELTIKHVNMDILQPILHGYRKLNITIETKGTDILVPRQPPLRVINKHNEGQVTIKSSPWPGFPSDLIPLISVLATQASGNILIHERMYDTRFFFVDSLTSMGANVVQCDPHRIIVVGPSSLLSTYLETPDVRTGLAVLGASLIAKGESTIDDANIVDRVFFDIFAKLSSVGASIYKHAG